MSSNSALDPFLAPSQALNALRLNARKLVDQQGAADFDVQSQLKRQFQLLRRTKKVVDQWAAETNAQFFRNHQQSLVNVRQQLDELPLHCLLSALDAELIHDKRFAVCKQLANSQRLTSVYQTFIELLWRAARCDVRDSRFQQKHHQLLGHLQQILEQVLEELNFAIDADHCPETRSRWPQWSMPWGQRKSDRVSSDTPVARAPKKVNNLPLQVEQARINGMRALLQSNGMNLVGFDQRLCTTFYEFDEQLQPLFGNFANGEHINTFIRELAKLGKLPAGPLLQQLEMFVGGAKGKPPQGEFSVAAGQGKVSRYSWLLQAGSELAADRWRLVVKRKAAHKVESMPPLLQQRVNKAAPVKPRLGTGQAAARSADPLWSEFCSDAASALREMQTLAGNSNPTRRQEGLNSVLAIAHLLRGDASMLGLKVLAEQFAQIEHCAANLLTPKKDEGRAESAAVLGTLIARASVVLDDIRKRKEGALSGDVQGVRERLERFAAVLAKAQGKLAELTVNGDIDAISKELRMPLLHLWVQWVHNALSHGNEGPIIRQSLGKPNALQLTLNLQSGPEGLDLLCKDDGRGFDFDRCRQRLISEGCAKEIVESLPPSALVEDLLRLRPRDHLPTEQARGTGLAACAQLIRGLGGTLQIKSKHQQGVGLQIRIPKK